MNARAAEAAHLFRQGVDIADIRKALGYKDDKAVRGAVRKVLGTARPVTPRPPRRIRTEDGDPGLPVSILLRTDRATQRLIERQAQERVERLERMLRVHGLCVSQMSARQLGDRARPDAVLMREGIMVCASVRE